MGMFSWKTSEGQSIANAHSDRPTFTVWMVLPDGTKYQEDRYGGYGEFGGKDVFEVISALNGDESDDSEAMRTNGINLCGAAEDGDRADIILPRFTSDPDKKWEDLKDPERCPDQGYFYDDPNSHKQAGAASPRELVERVEALEQALSIALQYVPLDGEDAQTIYELEKSTYIKNAI